MLIDGSYFIGERNIANIGTSEVDASVGVFIAKYEKEYLQRFMGYELSKNFKEGLLQPTPDARYTDILFGKEFTGLDGILKKWDGLVSVTTGTPFLTVGLPEQQDIIFIVGVTPGAPINGVDTYVNPDLAGKAYKVTQRGFGPLEQLLADDSNAATADIEVLAEGGFKWLGATRFSKDDKYFITPTSTELDVSSVEVVPWPESPIADFIYFYYLRDNTSQTQAVGEKRNKQEHAIDVSAKYKMMKAWNDMVSKNLLLMELFITFPEVYPEWQLQSGRREMRKFITKINPHF